MLSRQVRFALSGCGAIACKHATVIQQRLKNASLVAVCDIHLSRARSFAEKYGAGVRAFDTCQGMIETIGDQIEVLGILTPSGMHASGVIEAAMTGVKNIVVEKPLALSIEDANAVVEICNRLETRVFVVKQNRYNKACLALRKVMDAGRFKKIVSGAARVRWCRTADYYQSANWRGTWQMDGGVFANQAVHHLDLLTWLLGDVVSVFAYTARRLARIEAEDTGVAVLRFASGAIGSIEATTAVRPVDIGASISVLGENGAVEIGGFAADRVDLWQFCDPHPDDEAVMKKLCQNPTDGFAYAHAAYLQDVVDCILADRPAPVDAMEGLKAVRLLNAIYESVETGHQVFLDDNFLGTRSPLGKVPKQALIAALNGAF